MSFASTHFRTLTLSNLIAPAWMKLITTFPLERYEIATGHTPECAVAGRNSPQPYDAATHAKSMRAPEL
jgi:hypothetical protein